MYYVLDVFGAYREHQGVFTDSQVTSAPETMTSSDHHKHQQQQQQQRRQQQHQHQVADAAAAPPSASPAGKSR